MREIEQRKRLAEYFKKNLAKGYTQDTLKWALISQGYSITIVNRAIEKANKELAESAPKLEKKIEIKNELISEEPNIKQKSFFNYFKPNTYNILISLIVVILAYVFGALTAQEGISSNLSVLLVITYVLVSIILSAIKKE